MADHTSEQELDVASAGAQRSLKSRGRLGIFIMGFAVVAMVFGVLQNPRLEISNWYLAAAINKHAQGDTEEALQLAEKAESWRSSNVSIYLERSKWQMETGNIDDAIDDLNYALELKPFDLQALSDRAQLLQRAERHEEAIADMDEYFSVVASQVERELNGQDVDLTDVPLGLRLRQSEAWNNRAYFIARAAAAGEASDERVRQSIVQTQYAVLAVQEYRQLLQRRPYQQEWERLRAAQTESTYLDTLGYLQLLAGEDEAALTNLNRAVHLGEQTWALQRRAVAASQVNQDELAALDKAFREHMAVILNHRAQAFEKLGREEDAHRDFDKSKELGYDPEKGVW